jgi:hypothetical protein
VLFTGSQAGLVPLQSEPVTHPTQLPVDVLHTGVGETHWVEVVAEHCTHAPLAMHAGNVADGQASVAVVP